MQPTPLFSQWFGKFHGNPPILGSPSFVFPGSATFSIKCLVLALWPRKFALVIPWFGWLMVPEGVTLLVSGLRLGIGSFPFCGDVTACFVGGGGIIAFAQAARS